MANSEILIEWGKRKRTSTLVKHGIDFLDAISIFDGRPVVHAKSNCQDEERWLATGQLGRPMVSLTDTCRDDGIRINTARRARKNEQQEYNSHYSGGGDRP